MALSFCSAVSVRSPVKPSTLTHLPDHLWPFKYQIPFSCPMLTPVMPFNRSLVVTVGHPALVIYRPSSRHCAISLSYKYSVVPSVRVLSLLFGVLRGGAQRAATKHV